MGSIISRERTCSFTQIVRVGNLNIPTSNIGMCNQCFLEERVCFVCGNCEDCAQFPNCQNCSHNFS